MPIVFDEVVGTVEPETPPPTTDDKRTPPPKEPDLERARHLLRRVEQRAERLRAD